MPSRRQELAINALRTVVAHPKNPESFVHAEKLLSLIDDYLAKHAPKPAPLAPAKNPEAEQDVSDLV